MSWIKLCVFSIVTFTVFKYKYIILPFSTYIFNFIGLVCLSWFLTNYIHWYFVMKNLPKVPGDNRSVLITGCDSGFGYLTALKLNSLGFYVFATCLDIESDGAKELPLICTNPRRLKVLQLNVTNESDIIRIVKEVERKEKIGIKFWSLINNAGITIPGPIEWQRSVSVTDYMQILDVNLLGSIRMCRAFIHLLRSHKEAPGSLRTHEKREKYFTSTSGPFNGGRIINISSQAARNIAYGQVSYCVSKAALSKFNEGLSTELSQFGIKCISIEPFFYRTQVHNLNHFENILIDKWNESPKEVQLSYGAESLEESLILSKYFVSSASSVSENLHEVPNLIVDAVTTFEPDPVYNCVPFKFYLLLWLLQILPWNLYYLLNQFQYLFNRLIVYLMTRKWKDESNSKEEKRGKKSFSKDEIDGEKEKNFTTKE